MTKALKPQEHETVSGESAHPDESASLKRFALGLSLVLAIGTTVGFDVAWRQSHLQPPVPTTTTAVNLLTDSQPHAAQPARRN
jgi:hypothetical protein